MKTTQELAENYLSSKDLKKRATALKRVASGIKSESANASFLKLDAKELPVSISAKAVSHCHHIKLPLCANTRTSRLSKRDIGVDEPQRWRPT